jgi:Mn2+/Fe2+ NRAMP family transporter
LFWSAVINGVIAVPMLYVMMHMASSPRLMGDHTIPAYLKTMGWATVVLMTVVVGAMIVMSF